MRRLQLTVPLLAAFVLLGGCVPTEFEDLRGEAQIFVYEKPGEYTFSGLGATLAPFAGTLQGTASSRVATSAGIDTPFLVYTLVLGNELGLGETAAITCDQNDTCPRGTSESLVGFPRWGTAEMCVATPSASTGEIAIRCELDTADNDSFFTITNGASGERFGESVAPIREPHPFGVAVFGAPGADSNAGAVYRLPESGSATRLDLSAGMGAGGEYGVEVAAAIVDADTVMVAAASSSGEVIVSTQDVDGGGMVTSTVIACLTDASPGWGRVLELGDLNGDGTPDLAVGNEPGRGAMEVVDIFDGTALPGDCSDVEATTQISCPDAADSLVACGASEFGSSLAIGDVNADGTEDLVVGAPVASVDGTAGAGAVFVFQGAPALTDLDDTIAVLRHPAPEPNGSVGAAVATVAGLDGRMEIATSSVKLDKVYFFMCTGLDGDSPETAVTMRCQPREPPNEE